MCSNSFLHFRTNLNLNSLKNLLYILVLASISIFFEGCEAVTDFPESSDPKPVPVIQALLTDQMEPQQVRFAYSTSLNNSVSSSPVENATIFVYTSKGDTMRYNHTGSGLYISKPYQALPDVIYTLVVQNDTSSFQASEKLIPMHGIDTIKIQYLPQHANDDSAYYLLLSLGAAAPGNAKFYQTKIIRNNVEITKEASFALITDKYDKAMDELKLQYAFKLNDTVKIELYSVSQKVYDFYDQLNRVVFLDYSSIGYMENPPCMFNNYALGFFQVSAVEKKSIVVR